MLCQFIASIDEDEESDEEDQDIAKALDKVAAYIISVQSDNKDNDTDDQILSHPTTIDDSNSSALFTA